MSTPQKHTAEPAPSALSNAVRLMAAVLGVVSHKFSKDGHLPPASSKLRSMGSLDSTPTNYQSILFNPLSNDALRSRLSRRAGGERLEFLLSCWNYDGAANPLQRFAQLSHIVERFVRDHADRPVELPERCRLLLLQEWQKWSREGRIPAGVKMAGLEAAAQEIHRQVADDPLTPFLLSQTGR